MVKTKPQRGIPVLRGWLTKDGTQIAVFCPYCNEMHFHGWPSGTPRPALEHKVKHCVGQTPFANGGYYVALFRKKDLEGLRIE